MASIDGGENPLYQHIAGEIRLAIESGQLAPGAQVPTESELAERHGVSRNTVRMALNALAHEGLITAGRARAGRLVRRREGAERLIWNHEVDCARTRPERAGLDDFVEQAIEQGREPDQWVEINIVAATDYIAERLQVPPGETVVMRSRRRQIDGQPSSISESYFPLDVAQGTPLLSPQIFPQGTNAMLAEIGHMQVRFVDEITTRMPDPREARRLDIGMGVPVLAHVRIGRTVARPVRVAVTILPGDRHKLRYDIPGWSS